MKSFTAISFALSLGLVLANPVDLVQRQTTSTCATGVHIMLAGGCQPPCPSDTPGLLSSVVSGINSAIPGSDEYIVPYDNSVTQGMESTPVMIQAATAYAASCPNTPIVFLGYSLGGIIVMNTLCGGVSSSLTKNVIAAITFGEETFVAGQSYDKGTCTKNAPTYARANPAACAPFAPVIQDYCDSGDPKCCTGGTSASAHYAYASEYGSTALSFIKSQYAAVQGTTPTPTGPPKKPPFGSPFSAYVAWYKALLAYYKTHPLF